MHYRPFTPWLSRTSAFWFSVYTALAAFLLYTAVYGFRKSFSSATFDGYQFIGIGYKVWMITAQVLGYATSKFIGIKFIAELRHKSRAASILALVAVAGLAWLLFALLPAPFNLLPIFMNGLSLGLIWGLIFSYLEGRLTTDALGAALSVSFIVSAGFSRSAGSFIMIDWQVPEIWMPFTVCVIFSLPLMLFLWCLDQVPPPRPEDERMRTKRVPMDGAARGRFIKEFGPGLVVLILAYILLTVLRDFRDNFSAELWAMFGYTGSPEIFVTSEIPVALVVLFVIGSLVMIRNNQLAFQMNHVIVIAGLVLIGLCTWLREQSLISPVTWMILTGTGLYLGYIPFNCILFERMIAAFRYTGTAGFVMYLSDAFGYAGSAALLLVKEFHTGAGDWAGFFSRLAYIVSAAGTVLMLMSWIYFRQKAVQSEKVQMAATG